jgi:uncharacterized protein
MVWQPASFARVARQADPTHPSNGAQMIFWRRCNQQARVRVLAVEHCLEDTVTLVALARGTERWHWALSCESITIKKRKAMENFTPVSAVSGGILIGLSATLLLLLTGRIAGISGMLGGLIKAGRAEMLWRGAFLAGIVLGAYLFNWLKPDFYQPRIGFPLWLLVVGGFLVGFGTRMGNGCTSGHAVCGIARLSIRSIVATFTFMLSGFVTVFISQHLIGH